MEKNGSVAELDMARLQEMLERERRRRKMTHLEVAAELGVSDATVRQWRRGFGMNGDTALRLALLLRVDLRDFARQDPLPENQKAALETS
jgi:transcriptional regulator with XRE-family HTH domain